MNRKLVIGLSGPIGSGKTTVAKHLSTIYNIPIISFAKPLKQIIYHYFKIRLSKDNWLESEQLHIYLSDKDFESLVKRLTEKDNIDRDKLNYLYKLVDNYNKVDNKDNIARQILQYVGTELFRSLKPDIWIDLNRLYTNIYTRGFIVDDVRFENEVDYIQNERSGFVFYLKRDLADKSNNHISEKEFAKFIDGVYIIDNNDSIMKTVSTICNIINNKK